MLANAGGIQLALREKVGLILSDMLQTKLVRRTIEVQRKLFDRMEVDSCGIVGHIPTLEFLQHRFSKMGHREPPCDPR